MKIFKRHFAHPPFLQVLVHRGVSDPVAIEIDLKRWTHLVLMVLGGVAILSLGTLLFFRELEINRKLESRVLELEVNETLQRLGTPTRAAATQEPQVLSASPSEATGVEVSAVFAKISQLTFSCSEESCVGQVTLVPTTKGTAQGKLLLVLETEIPRIGAALHTTEVRRRYFIYPGYLGADTFDSTQISHFEAKAFRFSNALQTSAQFEIGKVLRPIALNAYVMDSQGAIVSHERQTLSNPLNGEQ